MRWGKIGKWLVMAVVEGIFLYIALTVIDPDFGWHIRLGEIIKNEGVPVTDPFSYTMKDYPFVDYEWGTNLTWYLVYNLGGQRVLAVIYVLIVLLLPWLVIPEKGDNNRLLWALSIWTVMLSRFAIRPQVVSWFLLAIVVKWMWDKKQWQKYRRWYPAVMLVWVNLHGSFLLGIGAVGVWIVCRAVINRRIDCKDVAIWLTGAAATLVNPYGIRDWTEVLRQMSMSGRFAQTVAEWIPGYLRIDPGAMFLIGILIIGVIKFRRSLDLSYGLVVGIIGIMTWGAQRNWPLFAVAAAPLAADIWEKMRNLTRGLVSVGRWRIFSRIIWGLVTLTFLEESYLVIKADRTMGIDFYPQKAVEYLKTRKTGGRIFNEYDWGGYLIWKLPGERFFVDGRMAGFNWKAPAGQSNNAFEEYLEVTGGLKEATAVFGKYNIHSVLLKKYGIGKETRFNLALYLESKGWQTEYEDKTALILVESGYEK